MMPALLTMTSMRPKEAMAWLAKACTLARSLTSSATAVAMPPAAVISATSSCRRSWRRAPRTTRAPCAARVRAMAWPMPLLAPVTRTTLSWMLEFMGKLRWGWSGGGGGKRPSVGVAGRRGRHAAQDHAGVVQHPIDELAIGGKAGVVHVIDVGAADRVAALVGTAAVAAGFVITAVGTQFMADVSVVGDPHAHPRVGQVGGITGMGGGRPGAGGGVAAGCGAGRGGFGSRPVGYRARGQGRACQHQCEGGGGHHTRRGLGGWGEGGEGMHRRAPWW